MPRKASAPPMAPCCSARTCRRTTTSSPSASGRAARSSLARRTRPISDGKAPRRAPSWERARTRGTRRAQPEGRAEAQARRWRRGSCRSATAAMRAAPSASPRASAACTASSRARDAYPATTPQTRAGEDCRRTARCPRTCATPRCSWTSSPGRMAATHAHWGSARTTTLRRWKRRPSTACASRGAARWTTSPPTRKCWRSLRRALRRSRSWARASRKTCPPSRLTTLSGHS